MGFRKWLVGCGLAWMAVAACAQEPPRATPDRSWQAGHARAIALARQGAHDQALSALYHLQRRFPDAWLITQDIIVVTAWRGDCPSALRRYHAVRHHPERQSYLFISVADCLTSAQRHHEAIVTLREGVARWPSDGDLLTRLEQALQRVAQHKRNDVGLSLASNDSDQGNREWLLEMRVGRQLGDRTGLYLRYFAARADDPEFETGDLNRLGIGLYHTFRNGWGGLVTFSGDTQRKNETGMGAEVSYAPSASWVWRAGYEGYAEDVPLRAKAQDIEATRAGMGVDYHSLDYRWSWGLSGSRYEFSDDNRRTAVAASLAYAFEMQPWREQRLIVDTYGSGNSLTNTVYYNPRRDASLALTHRTDFVFRSRWMRHVDHLGLTVGAYEQHDYGTHGTWGASYEQDYDLTALTSLQVGAGYYGRVYDGEREREARAWLSLNRRF